LVAQKADDAWPRKLPCRGMARLADREGSTLENATAIPKGAGASSRAFVTAIW
jgi:hypothetical protein